MPAGSRLSFGPLIAECCQTLFSFLRPFGNAVALVPSELCGDGTSAAGKSIASRVVAVGSSALP